jgi:hypothetical protein
MLADFIEDLVAVAPLAGAGTHAFSDRRGERIGFVQLIPESQRVIRIHRIWALQPHRGDGSAMLKQLCELADRHAMLLKLKALPFGSKPYPLSCAELIHWYKRHGFGGTRRKMFREPRLIRKLVQQDVAAYIGE